MSNEQGLLELNKKLGVIISLLLKSIPTDKPILPLREQIRILNGLGLRPKEIAEVLGRNQTYINKEIGVLKRSSATKKEEINE